MVNAELLDAVQRSLERDGSLQVIRAQLRRNVKKALQDVNGSRPPQNPELSSFASTEKGKNILWMVHDLLESIGLHETLAVFEAEANCKKPAPSDYGAILRKFYLPSGTNSLLERLYDSRHVADSPGTAAGRKAESKLPELAALSPGDSFDSGRHSTQSSTPSPKPLSPVEKKRDHKGILDHNPPPRSHLHALPLGKTSPRHEADDKADEPSFESLDSSHDSDSSRKRGLFPNHRALEVMPPPAKPLGKAALPPLPDLKRAAPAPPAAPTAAAAASEESVPHSPGGDDDGPGEGLEDSAASALHESLAESLAESIAEGSAGPEHDSSDGRDSDSDLSASDAALLTAPELAARRAAAAKNTAAEDIAGPAADGPGRANVQRLGPGAVTRSTRGWEASAQSTARDLRDDDDDDDAVDNDGGHDDRDRDAGREASPPRVGGGGGGLLASLRMRNRPALAAPAMALASEAAGDEVDELHESALTTSLRSSNQDDEEEGDEEGGDRDRDRGGEGYEEDYASEDELVIEHSDVGDSPARPARASPSPSPSPVGAGRGGGRMFEARAALDRSAASAAEDDYGEDFEEAGEGDGGGDHRGDDDDEGEEDIEELEEIEEDLPPEDMSVGEMSSSGEGRGLFRQTSGVLPPHTRPSAASRPGGLAFDSLNDSDEDGGDGGFNPHSFLSSAAAAAASQPRLQEADDADDAPPRIVPLKDSDEDKSVASEEFSAGDGDSAEFDMN